jgi:hypothetical protein
MADEASEPQSDWLTSRFLMSPALSWTLIAVGIALMYLFPAPSLLKQVAQNGLRDWLALTHLFAITILPILGFWRLSAHLGLPRLSSLLYLLSPILTLGLYLARTFLERVNPHA